LTVHIKRHFVKVAALARQHQVSRKFLSAIRTGAHYEIARAVSRFWSAAMSSRPIATC
jgi:hypothetical protein